MSGPQSAFATLPPEVFEQQSDVRRATFDASQGFEHRARFVDRLRRMRSSLCFKGVPMRTHQALGAMEVELLQCFHATCVRQLSRGA